MAVKVDPSVLKKKQNQRFIKRWFCFWINSRTNTFSKLIVQRLGFFGSE